MTRTTLAVAADYADALLVARRSKNALFLLLLLVLLLQVAVFLMYRFDVLHVVSKANPTNTPGVSATVDRTGASVDVSASATQPSAAAPLPAKSSGFEITLGLYRWVLNVTTFLGVTLMIVLAVVLLLTAVIMLVGRLIGVSHVTSAFVWCVFLAAILFPWQSLLTSPSSYSASSMSAYPDVDAAGFTSSTVKDQRLPGVLLTWTEVERESRFASNRFTPETVLHWARFAGWPAVALLLLLTIQVKSSRGLRFALGEADIPVEVNTVKPTTDTGL